GLLAEYATPADLMHAAEKIRDAGFRRWDVFSPFPVHGMNQAMGLKNSKVGWFAFCGGVSGYTVGMIMIWWMNAHDYAIVVGGKPGSHFKQPPLEVFPDMDRQPKLRPQQPNLTFASGRTSQEAVPGTVARGDHYENSTVNTGRQPSQPGTTNFVATIPVPVTEEL